MFAVPVPPDELGPQALAPLAATVAEAVAAAAKALEALEPKARKEADKSLKKAAKAAAKAGGKAAAAAAPGGVDEAMAALREDGAAAATAAAEARAPFAWVDGPLVTAMRLGDMILVDEINLAEDAVLERLNRWAGGACANSVVALVWNVAGVVTALGIHVTWR